LTIPTILIYSGEGALSLASWVAGETAKSFAPGRRDALASVWQPGPCGAEAFAPDGNSRDKYFCSILGQTGWLMGGLLLARWPTIDTAELREDETSEFLFPSESAFEATGSDTVAFGSSFEGK
jgi:hypothetical protein